MYIKRDFTLDEESDWKENVQPKMSKYSASTPVYAGTNSEFVGWDIKPMYE